MTRKEGRVEFDDEEGENERRMQADRMEGEEKEKME